VLADGAFQEFSMAYTARVLAKLKKEHAGARIPRIVFTKGGGLWLEEMGQLDCEVLGLDWTVNLGKARAMVGGHKALQGNIDPNVLFAPPQQIEAEVIKVLDSFGAPHQAPIDQPDLTGPTHVFNLGHGISQYTPPEHVSALVESVHAHSRKMRQKLR
jgi:uroporphyrinogen decarboxylase